MHRSLLSFCVLLAFLNTRAQPVYHDIESNHSRVDPEWIAGFSSGGFCWAYDIIADKDGNTYSTGYFKRYLSVEADSLSIVPDCKNRYDCSEHLFLIKRNPAGKILWTIHTLGNCRPQSLLLDPKGNLLLLGLQQSTTITYHRGDSLIHTQNGSQGHDIFLCRIDTSGQILKSQLLTPEGKSEYPGSMVTDHEGNLYIGGVRNYRTKRDPSYVQRSYLLMKLDKDWKTDWVMHGDTLGQSQINGIAIHKNRLYAVGSFSREVSFGQGDTLRYSREDQIPFVSGWKLNGKNLWAKDSVGPFRSAVMSHVVCDRKGNVFAWGGSSYSYSMLARFSHDGELIWTRSQRGKASIYCEKMRIDDQDRLYLGGEGYGSVFESNGNREFSFKGVGGTDPFLASYNTEGELLWMKAYGGKGTDYCKSFCISDSTLHTFGWSNNHMNFHRKVSRANSGYAFYQAAFSLALLEKDRSQEIMEKPEPPKPEFPHISRSDCSCEGKPGPKISFAQRIVDLLEYPEFQKATGWSALPGDSSYEHIFFHRLQNSTSYSSSFYSMNLIGFRPAQLLAPDSAFVLSLFNCPTEDRKQLQEFTLNYEYPMRRYQHGYTPDNFDHSAEAYLDILRTVFHVDDREFLLEALFDNPYWEYGQLQDSILAKYGWDFSNSREPEDMVAALIDSLETNSIECNRFLLDLLILQSPDRHPVTPTETRYLEDLFFRHHVRLEQIDLLVYPAFRAQFSEAVIRVRSTGNLLREWDPIRSVPVKDENNRYIPASFLLHCKNLEYNSREGFSYELKNSCFRRALIGETGVLMDAENVRMLTGLKEERGVSAYSYQLRNADSSIRIISPESRPRQDIKPQKEFRGLEIGECRLFLDFMDQKLAVKGTHFAIAPHFLTGTILLEAVPLQNDDYGQTRDTLEINGEPLIVSIEDIEAEFRAMGFHRVRAYYLNGTLQVAVLLKDAAD